MILYHGTNLNSALKIYQKQVIDVSVGSKRVDFGQGFYLSDNIEYVKRWAFRKAVVRKDYPAVITVEFDKENAEPFIEYFPDDLRWGRFIINNRNGLEYIDRIPFKEHNLDGRYHITMGRFSDIDVIEIADELKQNGMIFRSLNRMSNIRYPMQYAFHVTFSLQYISNIRYTALWEHKMEENMTKRAEWYKQKVYEEMLRCGYSEDEISYIIGKTGFREALEEYTEEQLHYAIEDAVDEMIFVAAAR